MHHNHLIYLGCVEVNLVAAYALFSALETASNLVDHLCGICCIIAQYFATISFKFFA